MSRWTLAALGTVFLASCGGGGSGGGEAPRDGFLTADSRGIVSGGESMATAPGASAVDAATELSRAIEEADLYRVDGDHLYLLNAWRGLVVVDLAGPSLVGRLPMKGVPQEMFLRGAHAFVVLSTFEGGTEILDVSTADPASPALIASFPLAGACRTSRLVGSVLYVLTDTAAHSFDASSSLVPVASLSIPGGAELAHATDSFLFVAAFDGAAGTRVTLVDVSNPGGLMALRGSKTFPGYVSDEFKMHYGANTFRIVTHDWVDGGLSRLFVVDVSSPDAPFVRGALELARGEQLFATRFTDEAAFVVTFEQVDPLWVIDLRDPSAPVVTGSLIVPGWSTHLVALPGRLVALGIDPTDWHATASLFDVSDPVHPTMSSRIDFGWGWSSAFHDVRGLGVFEADGLVLVPFSGDVDALAVLSLSASSLSMRGSIGAQGTVLRGFPHPRGICAISAEEVVIADATTLATAGRATVAENVADVFRVPDGRLLQAIRRSDGCRIGGVDLPIAFSRAYLYGATVTVTGWDDTGSAAYVIDFAATVPVVSARIALESRADPTPPGKEMGWGVAAPDGVGGFWGGFVLSEGIMTDDGRLALRSWSPGSEDIAVGTGAVEDGFVVIDVPSATLETTIAVRGAWVTGFVADGNDLVFTYGTFAGGDGIGRPLIRHDLVRVALALRTASTPVNVPGFVVSARAGRAFTVEETWSADWSYDSSVVASDLSTAASVVVDRLPLPSGSYDYRAAGTTLWFTTYGAFAQPVLAGVTDSLGAMPFAPSAEIRTVRLGATLSLGASIVYDSDFASLLLPEEGSALVIKNGVAVDRWDVTGASATLDWTTAVGGWPESARSDPLTGDYVLALGFGGYVSAP